MFCAFCQCVTVSKFEFSNLTNREVIKCRYCLDPRGLVPWARDDGRECARCRSFCHWLSQDSSDPKKTKQQFSEDVKSSARRKQFIEEELPEYQKLADENGGRAPSRKSQKKVEAAQEMRFICSVSCLS